MMLAALVAALVAAGCGSVRHAPAAAAAGHQSARLAPVWRPGGSRSAVASAGATGETTAIASLASRALGVEPLGADVGGLPRGVSAVASAVAGPVAVYASPHDPVSDRQFPSRNPFGFTQVFLVKRSIRGWLEVYLPVRPNDATAWVRASSVRVRLDQYRVIVDTARHELTILRAGRAVMHAPVGVGKAATPTPHGLFYVLEELRMTPSTGPYGTYAFGLSAYSNVLTTFGSGDAQVALHGTDEPWTIGENTSNGCIHMSDTVADELARTLPLGTPVQIV